MSWFIDISGYLIGWCNENTGFLMALLTAVYVIATISIVIESQRSNRFAAKFEKDRNRPHVVFWIEADMRTNTKRFTNINFVGKIRNEGSTTAHNVRITTDPVIRARQGVGLGGENAYYTPTFLEAETSLLVPNQTITETIGPTKFLLEDNEDESLRFKVKIDFRDIGGESYSCEYEIDLSKSRNRMFSEDSQAKAYYDLVDRVTEISQSMEGIDRALNQPDRSNLFVRENLELNEQQIELVKEIAEAEEEAESKGSIWFLREQLGRTCITRKSDRMEIEVEAHDIQTLCRSGLLRGYYRNGTLYFYVGTSAKNASQEE